jgi:spore germination protein YaaH
MPHRPQPRTAARQRRRLVLLLLGLATLVLLLVLLFTVGPFASHLQRPGKPPLGYLRAPLGGRAYRVAAWTLGDAASLQAATNASAVDEVDFNWYRSQAEGSVAAVNENLNLVAAARDHDLNLFATVTNQPAGGGGFSRKLAAAILATAATRRRHIDALVQLVLDKGYDGIDLDWEELTAADRERFSLFVEELAAALHHVHRFLSVAVYPKTSEPGKWETQKSEDYRRIGAAADEVKLMTYAYSGPWSQAGPQAPYQWLDEVLTLAEKEIPARKIAMGVPFFGFDWHGEHVTTLRAASASAAAKRYHAVVTRDAASGEAVLRYVDANGTRHVAYYQDARAVAAKLSYLRRRHPKVSGVAFWVMGQEQPATWHTVERSLR